MGETLEEWYIKNKMDLLWYRHRLLMGFNTDGSDVIMEKMHWNKLKKIRKKIDKSNDPDYIFDTAVYLDKEYHLARWWEYLSYEEKKKYLIISWKHGCPVFIYGISWWLPYFQELGYITDCGMQRPDKPIKLYRGSEPMFRKGMSWTHDKDVAVLYTNKTVILEEKKAYGAIIEPENILATTFIPDGDDGFSVEYIVNTLNVDDEDIKEINIR